MCRAQGEAGCPHGRRCPPNATAREAALKRRRENRAIGQQIARWAKAEGKADELAELKKQRELEAQKAKDKAETAEALYFRAHDLKGLGSTYGYPLVTRIAASLCRMLDDPAARLDAPLPIVDAHIDAIRAVVRDGVSTDEYPAGRALVEGLEAQVAEHRKA